MPYITQKEIDRITETDPLTFGIYSKGQLNWLVTQIIIEQLKHTGMSYYSISETISAVRDAAREAERRLLEPYEDKKLRINPDPYEALVEELRTDLHGVNAHESR